MDGRDQAPIPSGLWFATFVEGAKKHVRQEERYLFFTTEGNISGSGNFNSTLVGRFKLPDVQWTETYSWGTIKTNLTFGKPAHLDAELEV